MTTNVTPPRGDVTILCADVSEALAWLPDASVQCCVTSPPYWGLRDYGHAGQIGLEPTPADYVAALVVVFDEVRRVLKDDGVCWLNLGDSYARNGGNVESHMATVENMKVGQKATYLAGGMMSVDRVPEGSKVKELIGIPWRVAFALQKSGWYLRQDIIWHKPNPMPEAVTDRCTKAHEYVFLLTKSAKYYYDAEAIKEPVVNGEAQQRAKNSTRHAQRGKGDQEGVYHARGTAAPFSNWSPTRNKRSVWTVTPQPYKGAHFATFPPKLIEPMILAGSQPGQTVLDPFFGAGTTGMVASRLGRHCIGIELNPEYCQLAETRIHGEAQ